MILLDEMDDLVDEHEHCMNDDDDDDINDDL